jgi:hypothetical protein
MLCVFLGALGVSAVEIFSGARKATGSVPTMALRRLTGGLTVR